MYSIEVKTNKMARDRYAKMQTSSNEHNQLIARAITKIREGKLEGEARKYVSIVLGCSALGLSPALYSNTAQTILNLSGLTN